MTHTRFAAGLLLCSVVCFGCGRKVDDPARGTNKTTEQTEQSRVAESGSLDPDGDPFGEFVPRQPQARINIVIAADATDGALGSLDVRVTNVSTTAVGWDRQCGTFTRWIVTDASGNEVPSHIDDTGNERPASGQNRFVLLQHGESFDAQVSLSRGVLESSSARFMSTGGMAGVAGGEQRRIFDFSEARMPCTAQLDYDAADFDAEDGFAVYFGFRPTKVGIDFDRAQSNIISLRRSASR